MSKKAFYEHVAQTSDHPLGLEIERAQGLYLYTSTGDRYLDFISGIAVSSLGHGNPEVIEAVIQQVQKHMHVMVYGEFIQKPQSDLAELLTAQLPEQLQRVYFVNSGTEANEGALKLAKKVTGRSTLVGFHNSYHGDTHGSLSVTGRSVYQDPFRPLLPDVRFLRFNNFQDLYSINEEVAAVIVEPIQGEGGIRPANPDWLYELRQTCTATGAILIFDEIQSGFGRTGRLFAFEHYEVVPDILTVAKSMGGGMPIGAFISSHAMMSSLKNNPPLSHVTTFGGHPVCCAAAHANLKKLLQGDYLQRALEIEQILKKRLKGAGIVEVRGKGAMLGLELESRELTQHVVEILFKEHHILLGWTLHSDTLIRLAPPLITPPEILNEVADHILAAIRTF